MTQHLSCLVLSCLIVACCLDVSILNTGASRGQEDDDDNTDLLELQIFFPPNTVHTEGLLRQESTPGLDQGTLFGPQHFSCKFSQKIALVTRPCAFQLHVQIVRLSSGGAAFFLSILA